MRLVTPNLFKTVSVNLDTGGINRLVAIAASEELHAHVQVLVLRRSYDISNFIDGFEEWQRAILWEPSRFQDALDGLTEDGTIRASSATTDEYEAMSVQEWEDLPMEERIRLFEEYERDRQALVDYQRRLIRSICYRPLGGLRGARAAVPRRHGRGAGLISIHSPRRCSV